ncbi:hypothetical protein HPB51_015675 [Rhipicephalus microplus]|uniref:Retrotransposon gag domain-containing protein n=1 Tax=Rhipicephalus microplus TaxID=6941 RepID=A0A9J6D5M3_RHIMP|nr:hypothetical protein HPB51_015675 [Rhipicephalus microplus]
MADLVRTVVFWCDIDWCLSATLELAAEKTEDEGTGATPDVYDSAVAALAKHFDATFNLVVKRHRFHRGIQFPGESIQEYVTALTKLAAMCSFMSQEESLRDQFVAGREYSSFTIPLTRRFSPQHGSQRPPRQVLPQRNLCLVQTMTPARQRDQPPDSFLLQKLFHAHP